MLEVGTVNEHVRCLGKLPLCWIMSPKHVFPGKTSVEDERPVGAAALQFFPQKQERPGLEHGFSAGECYPFRVMRGFREQIVSEGINGVERTGLQGTPLR